MNAITLQSRLYSESKFCKSKWMVSPVVMPQAEQLFSLRRVLHVAAGVVEISYWF